jgi:hypothetical protein
MIAQRFLSRYKHSTGNGAVLAAMDAFRMIKRPSAADVHRQTGSGFPRAIVKYKGQDATPSLVVGKEKHGLIDSGAVMGELRTASRYEAFIRDGAKVNYRAEWHPGDGAPFLGPERFVKKTQSRHPSPGAHR